MRESLWRHALCALALGLATPGCGDVDTEASRPDGSRDRGADDAAAGDNDAGITGDAGASVDPAGCIAPPAGARFAFLTSLDQDGSFGVGSADNLCAADARRANLCGRYAAWLSTSETNAIDRLPLEGAWVDVRSHTIFATRTALENAVTTTPLSLQASGAAIPHTSPLWTGTKVNGTVASSTCGNWSSLNGMGMTGFVGASGPAWTEATPSSCEQKARFACFGF
jgi:hypothetical protein